MKAVVPLAHGFEEIEAVTIIDVLRRADIEVTSVYTDKNPATGSHKIPVVADKNIKDVKADDYDIVILPGGMPGSKNLRDDDRVISLINEIYEKGGYIAAICAAPIVFSSAGLLKGRKVTCFPGNEDALAGVEYIPEPVIQDDRIITGKGPGCAIPFALKIVEILKGKNSAEKLKNDMQVYWM